jgi:acyl dehydratase
VFAAVPATPVIAEQLLAVVADVFVPQVLFGEHEFQFRRPIRHGDALRCRGRVIGLRGLSANEIAVTTQVETRDSYGAVVNEQFSTIVLAGGTLDVQIGDRAPDHAFDPSLRQRMPNAVVNQSVSKDQAFKYAEAAEHVMPAHFDEESARSLGLPGIVMQGMCIAAFAAHAVIGLTCQDAPHRLKRLAVSFSGAALPGEPIRTSFWRDPPQPYRAVHRFETSTMGGQSVLRNGLAVIQD